MLYLCNSWAKLAVMKQKTDHRRNMYHIYPTKFNGTWECSEVKTQGESFVSLLMSDKEGNM